MHKSGKSGRRNVDDAAARRTVAAALLAGMAAACGESSRPLATPTCVGQGMLAAELYGAYETSLDWRADTIECSGMPRPHGEGARLHFAGTATTGDEQRRLAFILGIPGLVESSSASELPANVTLMEEGGGRFFSTPDTSSCWVDVDYQEPAGGPAGGRRYRVGGVLYCVAPIPELHGAGSVSFADLSFVGEVDWESPQ